MPKTTLRFGTLFGAQDPQTASEDALSLIVTARMALEGDAPEDAAFDAWQHLEGSVTGAFELYRKGALPIEAVEVAAGFTAVARPKDYGVHPIWEVAEQLLDLAPAGEARTGAGARTPEEARTGARIAPLGAGGSLRTFVATARPAMWRNRRLGPVWEGVCCAFDAIGAASFAGLDRLGAVVDAAAGSPALVWLDEIACLVAREPERRARRKASLNALLTSGVLGENGVLLATVVRLGRKQLGSGEAAHDAWLRLAAAIVRARHLEEEQAKENKREEEEEDRAVIDRAARAGIPIDGMLRRLDRELAAIRREQREAEEEEGPFHPRPEAPGEVIQAIDGALHYALLGFRQLYGLEILRDALPRLGEALAGGGHLGEAN